MIVLIIGPSVGLGEGSNSMSSASRCTSRAFFTCSSEIRILSLLKSRFFRQASRLSLSTLGSSRPLGFAWSGSPPPCLFLSLHAAFLHWLSVGLLGTSGLHRHFFQFFCCVLVFESSWVS